MNIPLADIPAFPTDDEAQTGPNTWHFAGMTYRQWLAGLAMQGMCSDNATIAQATKEARGTKDSGCDIIARLAVLQADSLIAELERKPEA